MIGRLTDTALNAVFLSLTFEQLMWPQNEERYAALRAEALSLIGELGLGDVTVPEHQADLTANPSTITTPLIAYLSEERGRILGDTVALPLFFLNSFALRYTVHAGTGEPDADLFAKIEDLIEDLGLDRELAHVLERESGWVTLVNEGDEPGVSQRDVIVAASSFFQRVMEEFGRSEQGLEGVAKELAALREDVADFRAEFRAASQRLEWLVAEGNAEVMEALGEVRTTLVLEGIDPAAAANLTEGDPQGFWERLVRWFGGAPARDATEAAVWAALEFVPGGTGVKLGIKVAAAIRKSLKGSGK